LAYTNFTSTSLPRQAFANLTDLQDINLSGFLDLEFAVRDGVLDDLPRTLNSVTLNNCGLRSIPAQISQRLDQLVYLSLYNNQITATTRIDFKIMSALKSLGLSGNPIERIESGSFQQLSSCKDLLLQNTKLAQFDLSEFSGMNSLEVFYGQSDTMSKLIVTNPAEVPQSLQLLNFAASGLTQVHDDVDIIITREKFGILSLYNSKKINCDQKMHWMAKHVLCSLVKIDVKQATCDDGILISDYLRKAVPSPCQA